jgi:hypothetical protein
MTLPTGAISFSNINTELGLQATASLTLDANLVRLVASVGGTGVQTTSGTTIALNQLQGHAYGVYQNNTSVANLNVVTVLTAAGHYAAGKTYGVVTLGSSSVVGSTSTNAYGFTLQGTSGDLFLIQNAGYIVGRGGDGGAGGSSYQGGYPGGGGGSAFYTKSTGTAFVQLQNTGVIGGGGAGGYGGSYAQDSQNQDRLPGGGGGGGGGAGYQGGAGGPGGGGSYYGNPGGPGSLTSGGYGGSANPGQYGQYGSGLGNGYAIVGINYVSGAVGGTTYGASINS